MKFFARAFFFTGIVLGALIWISPDQFKIVAVPGQRDPRVSETAVDNSANTLDSKDTTLQVAKVQLVVNGVPFVFHMASREDEYVRQEARSFCAAHREIFSNIADDAMEKNCVNPVAAELHNQLLPAKQPDLAASASATAEMSPSTPSPPTNTVYQVTVPATNGKNYVVSFDAAIHGPFEVSERFCRENAAALGLEGEAQIVHGCIPHVGNYIAEQLASIGFVRTAPPSSSAQV